MTAQSKVATVVHFSIFVIILSNLNKLKLD